MRWIVTDDIYVETWRRLLEFANIELTLEEIARRHSPPATKSARQNYSKQASQARVCVLQAKEYFDAARSSTLFTSPNHAYYGAVALASLMLLVLGDGTKSLDYLRTDNRNNHHGLNLSNGCSSRTATEGFTLLEQTQAEVLQHGHFGNWYRVLPERGNVYANIRKSQGQGETASVNYLPAGGYNVPSYQSIQGQKFSILSLLKYLPDLDSELLRFGLATSRSRTTHEISAAADGEVVHTWRIHGCRTSEERDELLSKFSVVPRYSDALSCIGTDDTTGGIVRLAFRTPAAIGFTWPPCRETLSHDTISYADAPETHEVVDLYLVAYQLSMLSRYYPDIWVSFIESHCKGAKLVERATELLIKKLPILVLSMLSTEETVISTHRAPWK